MSALLALWGYLTDVQIVQVLMLILTALSAGGAFVAARATRRAAEAQLLRDMIEQYASPTMNEALRTLASWWELHGEAFARVWSEQRDFGPAMKVNEARRLVASYYEGADRLHQSSLITKSTLIAAVDNVGLGILINIIAPLEREINSLAETEYIGRLSQLCPQRVRLDVLKR
jgi:hypothetical protein